MRAFALCCGALIAAQTLDLAAQGEGREPLALLDVPFISQSELLCGGAAAAMVLRYWGERGISADTFSHLVDRSAAGIRTDVLVDELRRRGWTADGGDGDEVALRRELSSGRPVLTLIEDRPSTFHYVVLVGWHERGVVFHDPARGPFIVMSTGEFARRWRAARRWMAVVVPGATPAGNENVEPPASIRPSSIRGNTCEQSVSEGVRLAQSNELNAAERMLAAASLSCPAATRELAGLRVLQKRWPEAEDLALTAVSADRGDTYAWQVLAVSRFVQNDRLGALSAWNEVGEPRLDLVRIDGLTRTRHRVVERLLDARSDEVLTPGRFMRARRQLASLPSATSTRLEYVPVPSGLAELRAVVAERPLVPTGRWSLAAAGLVAAATREVRLTTGALLGGGEEVSAAWRFWPQRRKTGAGIHAPTPWGGIWSVDAFSEEQPFTMFGLSPAERDSVRVAASDWSTGWLQWTATAGMDIWAPASARVQVGGRVELVTPDDRLDAAFELSGWPGSGAFSTIDAGIRARSSTAKRDVVLLGRANLQFATRHAPLDLWWAGDTGHVRSTLLRAHPLLDDGRLRVDRLGRTLGHFGLEAQRWWTVAGPISAAAAVFGDVARTAQLYASERARHDVDVGIGAHLAVAGIRGLFSATVAKGLADGATAFSLTYTP
jgi:hypothetical protein